MPLNTQRSRTTAIDENFETSTEYVDRENRPTIVTVSGASVRSSRLAAGVWETTANTALYYRQGGVGVNAVPNADHFLPAGKSVYLRTTGASDGYVAAIQSSVSGLMFLSQSRGDS